MTAIAASGMRARMESLEMLANNISNASTGGYKADREFYSLYVAPEAMDMEPTSTMPVIERPWIDLSQGLIHQTGNALDLAISGKGFFAANGPAGPLYTRNGSFRVSATGTLVTPEDFPVRGAGGQTITLNPNVAVEISPDGTIRQSGAVAGQLEIVDFPTSSALSKQGNNYLRADPSTAPTAATGATVEQGRLESSNAVAGESAVRLVSVMRQFEMLQKALTLGGEMNRRAVEEVAKVGS